MAAVQSLTEMDDWLSLWEESKTTKTSLLIFKRSPICPTSHYIEEIFKHFVMQLPATDTLRIFSVDVIGSRPISQRIAQDSGVQHESPQAILIKPGQKIAWHASHGDIDDAALTKHLT